MLCYVMLVLYWFYFLGTNYLCGFVQEKYNLTHFIGYTLHNVQLIDFGVKMKNAFSFPLWYGNWKTSVSASRIATNTILNCSHVAILVIIVENCSQIRLMRLQLRLQRQKKLFAATVTIMIADCFINLGYKCLWWQWNLQDYTQVQMDAARGMNLISFYHLWTSCP